jgi:hypothetical protein
MSYYNYVKDMTMIFAPMVKAGVPKSKMAVGFGWDTDNEITDPNDILAKCRYAIDSGYGGIMAWDITSAPTYVLDSIARYVTHNSTAAGDPLRMATDAESGIYILGNGTIRFHAPAGLPGEAIDLGMYDIKGALVKTLFRGTYGAAEDRAVEIGRACPGMYVFKVSAGTKTYAAKGIIAK